MTQWLSSLSKNGIGIIEWSDDHADRHSNHIDPFGASLEEYKNLVKDAGGHLISATPFTSNAAKTFVVFSPKRHRKKVAMVVAQSWRMARYFFLRNRLAS